MLTLQKNGRIACPESGLTSAQYATVMSQPRQCYSEKSKQFTFWPTPLGLHRLHSSGFVIPHEVAGLASRWAKFELHRQIPFPPVDDFSDVLRTSPWKHQPGAINFGMQCPSPYFNMGMGTGKSLCTYGVLGKNGHRSTLVLCPNAVVGVWQREARLHTHEDQYQVLSLDDSFKSVAKKLEAAHRFATINSDRPHVIVINYESARTEKFSNWATERKWDCVVCDEAHRIKSHSGPTTNLASNLECGQPIALSGTMQPHDPLDLWGQFRFLEPALLENSFTAFRKRYAIEGEYNQVVRWVNLEHLHERIRPLIYRVESSVLDLPPVTHQQVRFNLSAKVEKIYREFRKELIARIGDGVVTADNVLVKGLRLQQLTSGFFKDEITEQEIDLDSQPKIDAMLDWFDAIDKTDKFVVFTRFKRDVDSVVRALQKARPEIRLGVLTGARNDLTRDATFDPQFDGYIVNISSGGVGVDLTLANHALYYSVSWNAGDYEQSIARLSRPGQKKHCHFTHCIAAGTVDEDIYEAFEECKDLARIVIDGIRKGGAK